MKLLILGGTVFLGRQLVTDALAAGHDVTLFNRGKSNTDLFPEVERILGDRDGGLAALGDRHWDAVIDTCGYVPRITGDSARYLVDRVGHYTYISSISVYDLKGGEGPDECTPVGTLSDPATEVIDGETYGPLKALCEQSIEEVLPGRTLVVRPGLIVGPYDPTDRFTYWPLRIYAGGDILAPADPAAPTQVIDVRDLSIWILKLVAERATGIFNATGPETMSTMGGLLAACPQSDDNPATLKWVEESFLIDSKVQPFSELPCWVPRRDEALVRADITAALERGLRFRPLADSARDTLNWRMETLEQRPLIAGLSRKRERELLALWDKVSNN
ncbi:MAG: epimerase [bacterium]|nr:epimerase [bacterium]